MTAAKAPDARGATHDRVYRALRNQIMYGDMLPGQALTIRGIADQFSVSMTPAREAVRRLSAEGALTVSGSGRCLTPNLTNERIEELATLRAMLESELAVRALPRAHLALIERLQSVNEAMPEVIRRDGPSGYIRSNLEFHRTLYLRAQAPAMLAMAETVWLQLGPTMSELYMRHPRREAPHFHQIILASLRARDEPTLKLAVRNDVTQGLRMLRG